MIPGLFGFYVPLKGDVYLQKYSNICVYVFLLPAFLSSMQMALLLFIFKYDTPVFYSQKNQKELQLEANKKIYLNFNESAVTKSSHPETTIEESYSDLITTPYIKAFMIGWGLSFVQGLSGINWIVFYSTDIFSRNSTGINAEVAAKFGTFLMGLVNWISCMFALPLLNHFGRKTLLLTGQYGLIFCHFMLSI